MNLRKDEGYASRVAAWKATPPAVIQRPLNYILRRAPATLTHKPANGAMCVLRNPILDTVIGLAALGNGKALKAYARTLL